MHIWSAYDWLLTWCQLLKFIIIKKNASRLVVNKFQIMTEIKFVKELQKDMEIKLLSILLTKMLIYLLQQFVGRQFYTSLYYCHQQTMISQHLQTCFL